MERQNEIIWVIKKIFSVCVCVCICVCMYVCIYIYSEIFSLNNCNTLNLKLGYLPHFEMIL